MAEHALAGAHQVVRMDHELRHGVWLPRGGVQLYQRKIAVVGLGDIGQTFAAMDVFEEEPLGAKQKKMGNDGRRHAHGTRCIHDRGRICRTVDACFGSR